MKSNEGPREPHYAEFEPKPDENYTTLSPPPDTAYYTNENIELGDKHAYLNRSEAIHNGNEW